MTKTCEEYVVNKLEQLEWDYSRLESEKLLLQKTIREYKEQLQEVRELLHITIKETNDYGNNYYIDSDILFDNDDKEEFNRLCVILGLEV